LKFIPKNIVHMRKLLVALLLAISLFSCSHYYVGKVSDHFDGTQFYDPVVNYKNTFWSLLKWKLAGKSKPWPDKVEVTRYDVPPKRVHGDALRVSNVGHVTFLIQTQGLNILTDPVWSKRASPVSFAGPKRVIDPGIKFENLPPIDVVWISHNHYDHLDLTTIEKLWEIHKPRIIAPLGNDKIISSYNKNIVVETYDWGDEVEITKNVKFHLSPMQHWSARGLFDKNKALWAALTIQTDGGNIYFVGDSGYGNGRYFKKDKQKFGNFRLALLPMGAYEPRSFMEYAHMNPDDMVKAYMDLGEPYTVPSHYDVFKLTDEGRGEAKVALKEAMQRQNSGKRIKILEVGAYWNVPNLSKDK
jgi:L-ascorbate metabolism protein UlaG (beta-lactamase superfamily)